MFARAAKPAKRESNAEVGLRVVGIEEVIEDDRQVWETVSHRDDHGGQLVPFAMRAFEIDSEAQLVCQCPHGQRLI